MSGRRDRIARLVLGVQGSLAQAEAGGLERGMALTTLLATATRALDREFGPEGLAAVLETELKAARERAAERRPRRRFLR